MLQSAFDRFGVESLFFDYRPTDRNGPLREFLEKMGLSLATEPIELTKRVFLANTEKLFAKVIIHE
jgi:predicted enzyme involved in methoxymalonyl-ACP biosynthesis